jgi:Ser/Thr protein kinase RdoA (MazF antagonist)
MAVDARTELAESDFTVVARKAAALYGFDDGVAVKPFGSLTENPTFHVAEPGAREPIALRIYRLGGRPESEIRSELAWITAICSETEIRTPAIVPALDGQPIVRLEGPVPIFAAGFEVVPGREALQEDLPPLMERIGEITALLHRHARRWQAPPAFDRPRWDLDTMFGPDAHWGPWQAFVTEPESRAQLERLAATVTRRLARFGLDPISFGLIHADLRAANLLVDGDDIAIIDFDDCGFSWYLYDFGSTMTLYEDDPQIDELIASWTTGYRNVEQLSQDDENEIFTFVALRRLMVTAYAALRSDTALAEELRVSGFTAGSCELAERYLLRYA